MPAAITNTSKYYKTKASPYVYSKETGKYISEPEFFKQTGFKDWGSVPGGTIETIAGKLYQRPGDEKVYEYNPYSGQSYHIPNPDAFTGAGYQWGDIQKTTQDPSLLWGKLSFQQPGKPALQPTEQFIQDKAKQIPSAQQAYQPVLDQYKASLEKLLNPITQSYDQQIQELQKRANIEDYYKNLSSEYKLGDQENLIKQLTQQMLSTQGLLSNVPENIANVTKDFNVTQSGRELQQGRESAGLSKQLSELANTQQSGLAGYELSLGAIDRLLNARREQENRNMESLSMGLEKNKYLYDQYQPEAYNRLSTNLSGIGSDLDTQTQTIRDIIAERLGLAQEQRGLLANEGQNAYNKQMTEEQRAYDEALRQRMRGEELTDYENKYRLKQSLDAQYPTYSSSGGSGGSSLDFNALDMFKNGLNKVNSSGGKILGSNNSSVDYKRVYDAAMNTAPNYNTQKAIYDYYYKYLTDLEKAQEKEKNSGSLFDSI